jgi:hypothetical protein
MGKGTLLDSSRYKKFILDRDKALEQINLHTQTDVSRILFAALEQVEGIVASLSLRSDKDFIASIKNTQELEIRILEIFSHILFPITERMKRMRRATYTLSHLGELEAIGQATQKTKQSSGFEFKQKLSSVDIAPTLTGDNLDQRTWYTLMKLRSKIVSAYSLATIQKKTPKEVLEKVRDVFPKTITYKRPPRELKPFREAAQNLTDKLEVSTDFIDQDDWDLVQQAYKDTELPPSRFDNAKIHDMGDHGHFTYDWEMTQDMTDDFVSQVRAGQVEAANDLGISEFVWVAIIDNRTDDCCLHRNGLTTSEIEEKLSNGELDGDECDAVSPPAHPNCRCQLAPVASTEQVEGPDWKSFDDWLAS